MTNISPMPPQPDPVPASSSPTAQALAGTIIRSVLLILSTLGVTWATHFLATANSAAAINVLAGAAVDLVSAIVIVAMPVWGYLDKHWSQARLHKAAVMSANYRQPVMPAK